MTKQQWRTRETAPKDGSMFLADVGMPWPFATCWSKYHREWVYANPQINICDGEDDPYFETEYEKEKYLIRWQPLPAIKGEKKWKS